MSAIAHNTQPRLGTAPAKMGSLVFAGAALVSVALMLPIHASAATIGKPGNYLTLNTGLVGWWTMDGNDVNWRSGAVTDRSGQGGTLYAVGLGTSTSVVPGKLGQAMDFRSSGGYLFGGNQAPVISTMTLSAWIFPRTGGDGDIGRIIYTDNYLLRMWNPDEAQFIGICDGTDVAVASGVGSLARSAWNHVAVSWNGLCGASAEVVFTINGVRTVSNNLGSGSQTTGTADLTVSYSSQYFDGHIDDVRIYNRALSANEISALYSAGSAKVLASESPTTLRNGLTGWWTLDGADINWATGMALDRSGNSRHARIIGMATGTAPVHGVSGQALVFDGVNDYLDTNSALSNFVTADDHTVSMWVKYQGPDASDGERQGLITDTNRVLYVERDNIFGLYDSLLAPSGETAVLKEYWIHVVQVHSAGGAIVTYYSNPWTDDSWSFFSGSSGSLSSLTGTLRFGSSTIGGKFEGLIDDIRIWNRALSAGERDLLHKLGTPERIAESARRVGGQGLSNGLVGHWTFDGADVNWRTGAVSDRSGQGNTGYVVGMATSSSPSVGKVGQALSFDGGNDHVSTSDTSILDGASRATWSVWFNTNTVSVDTGPFVSKYQNNNGSNQSWYLGQGSGPVGGNDDIALRFNSAACMYTNENIVAAGNWYHVAVVYDGTQTGDANRLKMYVNGIQRTATSCSADNVPSTLTSVALPAYIGWSYTNTDYFPGKLDDVRIYNRALSATEVLQLYNQGR